MNLTFQDSEKIYKTSPTQTIVKTYLVASDTKPNLTYTINYYKDKSYKCACPAFKWNDKCKHINRIKSGDKSKVIQEERLMKTKINLVNL